MTPAGRSGSPVPGWGQEVSGKVFASAVRSTVAGIGAVHPEPPCPTGCPMTVILVLACANLLLASLFAVVSVAVD